MSETEKSGVSEFTPMTVMKKLDEIMEQHPLFYEFGEDGRYTWPERWGELIAWLTIQENRANETVTGDQESRS